MGTWKRMAAFAAGGGSASVAIVGAGFIGRGLVQQLTRAPGLVPALVVNRTPERARRAFENAGVDSATIVESDDPDTLETAIADGRPAVAERPEVVRELSGIDVVVEATGALELGARTILDALETGKHVVSMNAELDATLGYLLHARARERDVVYTLADGDQPGVLLRHLEFVAGMGFEIVAAVNCKRNLDLYQDPDASAAYARRDGTSVKMTTAFGDGTKMQIENAAIANLTGLVPDRRGMHGVETTLERAVADVTSVLSRRGVVEFTLGGDFGGGVFVIGHGAGDAVQPYMRYSKMGDGPDYLFFRPYHLLHFETPLTIAEVVLDGLPLGAPPGPPVAEVVAVAKRDLAADEVLDGIGGYRCYGQIDTVAGSEGLLPVGLSDDARMTRAVARDEPVPLDAVELDEDAELVLLRRTQDELVAGAVALARTP